VGEEGLDIGEVDLIICYDSQKSPIRLIQRMGRTGRRPATRRNCTFLTLSDKGLKMAMAIVELWRRGWVEDVQPPPAPWGCISKSTPV
jgi:ATP-dependent Lhr-like helicase